MRKILILRSWKSDFNRDDLLNALDVYDDAELEGIRNYGFNGIWIRGRFREIVPCAVFPEFGSESNKYLDTLNALVERAAAHGIGVYLYINEPAGFPADDPFWKKHPEVKGSVSLLPHRDHTVEGDENYYSLCTSTDEVKSFLKDSTAELLREVKGLAGIIEISASEYQTHCYAHIDYAGYYGNEAMSYTYPIEAMTCPRCRDCNPIDIVAEVNNLIYDGIKKAGSKAKLIAWNWSWNFYEASPQKELIGKLDKGIVVMADFERSGKKIIMGKERKIDEYSLSYIGPSGQAKGAFETARQLGHETMAKLQIGTTHELATVPSMSVIKNVFQKIQYLVDTDSKGIMACWNFGNMCTLNTYITGWGMRQDKGGDKKQSLRRLVVEYLPELNEEDIDVLEKAWDSFGAAMDCFPFNVSIMYTGAINFAMAYWLPPRQVSGEKSLGRSWLMDERGDDFSANFAEWSQDEIIAALEQLAAKWQQGLEFYREVFEAKQDQHSLEEYASAVTVGCCFTSAYHVYKLYELCSDWNESYNEKYLELCREELDNCRRALPFLARDKRLGFHSECQGYMFDEATVEKKVQWLEKLLQKEPDKDSVKKPVADG